MLPGFYRTAARQEVTGWMLMLALVSMILLPQCYHMHHVDDSVVHDSGIQKHVIDSHGHAEINDVSHKKDGHTINAATDIFLKTPGFQLPRVAILVTILLLLSFLAQTGHQYPPPLLHRLPRFNRHKIPPLRAPPRT